MRSIKKRLALAHIALIIGIATIAIPVEADLSSTAEAVVKERNEILDQQTGRDKDDAKATPTKDDGDGLGDILGRGVGRPQDDFYDARREHWEDRLEGRLDYREEYLEKQTGDNDDDAAAEDSKAGKDDEDDTVDQEHDIYERRREYWRQRLDKEW